MNFDTDTVLVRAVQSWLEQRGVGAPLSVWLSSLLTVVAVAVVAFLAHRVTRWLVRRAMRLRFRKARIAWDILLMDHGALSRMAHFVPALVFFHAPTLAFPGRSDLVESVQRFAVAYMVVAGCLTGNAVGRAAADGYEQLLGPERSIRSFVQVGEIVVWVVGAIMLLATFADRSPWTILGGLGAFAAVLVLVFKDALLGLVASVQLSRNDMLRLGDWLTMPSHSADGEVVEILLTTVKVKNWDKTTTMLPAHALIQHAFVNWRSVHEDEARRITRSLIIDHESIRAVDAEAVGTFPEPPRGAVDGDAPPSPGEAPTTNLGAFRRFATAWLRAHPDVRGDLTLLVRELEPAAEGLPVQVYCFCRKVSLAEYAPVVSDVIDGLVTALPRFGLRLTQLPSAYALRSAFGEREQPAGPSSS